MNAMNGRKQMRRDFLYVNSQRIVPNQERWSHGQTWYGVKLWDRMDNCEPIFHLNSRSGLSPYKSRSPAKQV